MMRNSLFVAALALLFWPSPAAAQNREHLQMNADLRMLQEHVSRLQLSVNRLDARIDDTNTRLDAAVNATTKGFADQQLLINQLSATLASVRERLDDNSVRVSQLGQEFTAIREGVRRLTEQINTLVGLLQPEVDAAPPLAGTPPQAAPPAAGNTPTTPADQAAAEPASPNLTPVIIPQSATYIYGQAQADYHSGRYESAIEGYREVIETFPDAPDAANAQFQIGMSYNLMKNCRAAIPEYQKLIDNHPTSERRHEAIYMLGYCYADVGQRANAQRAYQQVIKEYPESISAIQARTRLEGMGIKPQ
jgi:tol-pal system protein YbgF